MNPSGSAASHTADSVFIADLTRCVSEAEAESLQQMLPAVYAELRRVAAGFLREERAGHTLQPTALVHEAYLRMADQRKANWSNAAQLLSIFARMMRRILIDYAGARLAEKRGGKDALRVTLDDALELCASSEVNLLDVDAALTRLTILDPRQGNIVEMRFFGGLTIDEIGVVLAISPTTVKREWAIAKRWLQRELVACEKS